MTMRFAQRRTWTVLTVAAAIAAAGAAGVAAKDPGPSASRPKKKVLVEFYTSQG
jgi:hypothetical protein